MHDKNFFKEMYWKKLRVARHNLVLILIIFALLGTFNYLNGTVPSEIDLPINDYESENYFHPKCKCSKGRYGKYYNKEMTSTCESSNFRGPHQKVVTYSFYGDTGSGYFKGVAINAETVAALYPGWTVRLYHDIKPTNKKGMVDLCAEVCKFPHLDECYIEDLNSKFKKIGTKFGMLWRFLVLGDESVDVFAVRDLDSPIYQREVDAVNEWLQLGKTWHIMRDNPSHGTFILGGMWGARNKDLALMQRLRNDMISRAKFTIKGTDQALLAQIIWPVAVTDLVTHDSYLCQHFPETRPFPTRRVNMTFVGDMYGLYIVDKCPKSCRPIDHPDWVYC